jgi:hypothetical protein
MSILAIIPCVLLLARGAHAVHAEQGDAGENGISEAQLAVLTGPSDTITGNISNSEDADLFKICITDPMSFSASTVGTSETLVDTQLFVFNSACQGIVANDDAAGLRSRITSGGFLSPA